MDAALPSLWRPRGVTGRSCSTLTRVGGPLHAGGKLIAHRRAGPVVHVVGHYRKFVTFDDGLLA